MVVFHDRLAFLPGRSGLRKGWSDVDLELKQVREVLVDHGRRLRAWPHVFVELVDDRVIDFSLIDGPGRLAAALRAAGAPLTETPDRRPR
nr:hypothetical protein GCM10020093_011770 [Planobispora longispora]